MRFANFEGFLFFFCSVNHLSGTLGKHMFTCSSSKGHSLWFVIGGFRSVLFVSCLNVRCFVIGLFRAISLLRRFSRSFLFLSLARIKRRLPPSFEKVYSPSRFPPLFLNGLVILSQAGRARYIVICINPASTKMIDGTEKPKIPSKFAIRAARYNEFRSKTQPDQTLLKLDAKQ